jgi:hypothetical protein
MPRYFFHLEDGHTIIDHEGIELLNLRVARDQAVRSSGEILHDRTRSFL